MPKNLIQESLHHHVLQAIQEVSSQSVAEEKNIWEAVAQSLIIKNDGSGTFIIEWNHPQPGNITIPARTFSLYQRGDVKSGASSDVPEDKNRKAVKTVIADIFRQLNIPSHCVSQERLQREGAFHDDWADDIPPELVMVDASFEAATAPEHRFILSLLGDVRKKRILDLGCGLGEAAVYFAKQGGIVTACDLSLGMLKKVSQVAALHGVEVTLYQSPAESTGLTSDAFDIVYAGNLLHHVDTKQVLDEMHRVLKPSGLFVSWDPLAHNPIINVYRRMASSVRTVDEHPLCLEELALFRRRFSRVQWKCFWLCTLAVFLRFYFLERISPSKERYWKKILTDASRLKVFYNRLEKGDRWLLRKFPFLQRYCWNIVVWGHK